MTEAEIKEEFQQHLGAEWEIHLSNWDYHKLINAQLVKTKSKLDFRFKFVEKKRYTAIQMVIRLSNVLEEYGVKYIILDFEAKELL